MPLELPTFLVRAAIEDITSHEREWLEGHLAACVECANEAGAMAAAVESLRNVQVTVSPELLRRTRVALAAKYLKLVGLGG